MIWIDGWVVWVVGSRVWGVVRLDIGRGELQRQRWRKGKVQSGAPAAAADQHQRSQNLLFQSLSQSLLKLVFESKNLKT